MMGNMFAGIAASITSIHQPQQSAASPMQNQTHLLGRGQNFYQGPNQGEQNASISRQGSRQAPFANGYVRSINEQETDNLHYTNLS